MTGQRTGRARSFSGSLASKVVPASKSVTSFNLTRVKALLGTGELMKHAENGSHFWTRMTSGYRKKLEWQLRAIGEFRDKCCACITDARLVDDSGVVTTAFQVSGKQYRQVLGIEAEAAKNLAKSFDHFWTSTLMARTDVIRQVGRFDPHLEFAEDHDFLFRLSLATSYCYVSKPLSTIDRSCSPPGSTSRPWDQVEVRLRCRQSMLEKWLTSNSNLAPNIRKIVVANLSQTHSAWTNWYLEHERYNEARQSVSRAMKYEFTPMLAIKWGLTHVTPTFARRVAPKVRFH